MKAKIFNDSTESGSAIQNISLRSSLIEGIYISFFYAPENKDAIIATLVNAEIPIQLPSRTSLTIKFNGMFHREKIKTVFNTLKSANFISEAFLNKITDNIPDDPFEDFLQNHEEKRLAFVKTIERGVMEREVRERRVMESDDSIYSLRTSEENSSILARIFESADMRSDDRLASNSELFSLGRFAGRNSIFHDRTIQTHFQLQEVSSGPNAQKLTDLNFPEESVPEKYLCPLSLSIMSDPVYFENDSTTQRFERTWILKWLTEKGTHPVTRKAFESSALKSDNGLKLEIDGFLQNIEKNTPNIKPAF